MRLLRNSLLAAALFSVAAFVVVPAAQAIGISDPVINNPGVQPKAAKPGIFQRLRQKRAKPKASNPKPADANPASDKKSEREFREVYKLAYDAIYRRQDYAGGILILRALGQDDHPDVANLIGFSSRKIGRVEDARHWYEKALAADPKHTRTWQYYGMWHLEQGNRLKAEEHLQAIAAICGTTCEDFKSLKLALSGDDGTY